MTTQSHYAKLMDLWEPQRLYECLDVPVLINGGRAGIRFFYVVEDAYKKRITWDYGQFISELPTRISRQFRKQHKEIPDRDSVMQAVQDIIASAIPRDALVEDGKLIFLDEKPSWEERLVAMINAVVE